MLVSCKIIGGIVLFLESCFLFFLFLIRFSNIERVNIFDFMLDNEFFNNFKRVWIFLVFKNDFKWLEFFLFVSFISVLVYDVFRLFIDRLWIRFFYILRFGLFNFKRYFKMLMWFFNVVSFIVLNSFWFLVLRLVFNFFVRSCMVLIWLFIYVNRNGVSCCLFWVLSFNWFFLDFMKWLIFL